MSEHCDDDGKGGCVKHPPTMRLEIEYDKGTGEPLVWYWRVDQECPIGRDSCPALPAGVDVAVGEQVVNMAQAYFWIIHPNADTKQKLRRIQAAERLRAKGKVTVGVTFKG